jgi:DNA repair protein RecO (recombination protein O)
MKRVTPAIVLRVVDTGDADRVVTLLARDLGLVSAIARGARKSVRRFGAALSLFGVGEATLVERRGSDLHRLDTFHAARGFPHLASDLAKVAHGGYACELVLGLSPPGQPEPAVFDLLLSLFTLYEAGPARAETLRVFELRLLEAVGLRPQLDVCASCGGAPDGPGQSFSARLGGVLCGACGSGGTLLEADARRALARAQGLELVEAGGLVLTPALNAACRDAVGSLIADHIGRPLKSLSFIAKLNAS